MWPLLFIFIFLGVLIFLFNKYTRRENPSQGEETTVVPSDCCGAHDVCISDSLLSSKDEIIYFEDEDLDRFNIHPTDNYTTEEIEEFEEVFFTLKEDEISEWLKSLQLRGIILPETVKEQALLIVSERRITE